MFNRQKSMSLLMAQKRIKKTANKDLNPFATLFKQLPKTVVVPNICWDGVSEEDRNAANQLLQHVIDAEWQKIEKLIQEKSYFMFLEATATDIDDKVIRTSPLKYAIYALDAYTCQLFYDTCQKSAVEHPEYLKYFSQQAQEQLQKGFIDLEPLAEAYKEYLNVFNGFELNVGCRSDHKELNEALLAIGKLQHDILPHHMLREMCRKGFNGWPNSSFDIENNPRPESCEAIVRKNIKEKPITQSLLPCIKNAGLGIHFMLVRGNSESCRTAPFETSMSGYVAQQAENDLEKIINFCQVRTEYFKQLFSSLKIVPPLKTAYPVIEPYVRVPYIRCNFCTML